MTDEETYEAMARVLDGYGVPRHHYSLGEQVDGCVCLGRGDGGEWVVYEADRGHRIHEQAFASAGEAACHMLGSLVLDDGTLGAAGDRLRAELGDA